MRKLSISILSLLLFISLIFNSGCAKSNDAEPVDGNLQTYEQTAGYSAATMTDVMGKVIQTASTLGGVGSSMSSDSPMAFEYNESTGWWTFTISLSILQTATIRVQFNDASGNFHKFYNQNSTTSIKSTGEGSGTSGSFSYSFTITQMGNQYSAVLVNGSGSVTYQGTSSTFSMTNVALNKNQDAIPDGGQMAVNVQGCAFTIGFNGSTTIPVTFTYQGHSYTMTVNLATGQIS
ncbi:MAG: hypothetical protein ACM3SY_12185 [Candidatus Omnitrophota bacterium]